MFGLPKLILLLLVAAPALVSAGLFSPSSGVEMLDHAGFKKVMKEQKTAVVAFVAPWCGHCKSLSPEYSKAAKSLAPLVPLYAVDCDDDKNKPLCSEQGIRGFPTVKSFPRGSKGVAHEYQGERKAAPIVEWANSEVPNRVDTVGSASDIQRWVTKKATFPHAVLLNSQGKLPLLWRTLSNNFKDKVLLGVTRSKDKIAEVAKDLGFEGLAADGKSKILYWRSGEKEPKVYDGTMKFEPLAKFFEELAKESPSKGKEEL